MFHFWQLDSEIEFEIMTHIFPPTYQESLSLPFLPLVLFDTYLGGEIELD